MKKVSVPKDAIPELWVKEDGTIMTLEGKVLNVSAAGQVYVPRGPGVTSKFYNAAKLVATAYYGPSHLKFVVFKDGDRRNYDPTNLRWSASPNPRQEITEEMFDRIMLLNFQGEMPAAIAKEVGIGIYQVGTVIKSYERYKASQEE